MSTTGKFEGTITKFFTDNGELKGHAVLFLQSGLQCRRIFSGPIVQVMSNGQSQQDTQNTSALLCLSLGGIQPQRKCLKTVWIFRSMAVFFQNMRGMTLLETWENLFNLFCFQDKPTWIAEAMDLCRGVKSISLPVLSKMLQPKYRLVVDYLFMTSTLMQINDHRIKVLNWVHQFVPLLTAIGISGWFKRSFMAAPKLLSKLHIFPYSFSLDLDCLTICRIHAAVLYKF